MLTIQTPGYCRMDLTLNGDELTTVPVPFRVDLGGMSATVQIAKVEASLSFQAYLINKINIKTVVMLAGILTLIK